MDRDGIGSLLLRTATLVALAAGAGLALNAARSDGVRLAGFAPPVACDASEAGAPAEIEPGAAAGLCGRADVVIADTRSAERYAEGHIAGALHLPCDAGGRLADAAFSRLEGVKMVIVYGQTTADALPVAASLARRHYPPVRVLRGGFAAWDRAGLACASGPCDECKESAR